MKKNLFLILSIAPLVIFLQEANGMYVPARRQRNKNRTVTQRQQITDQNQQSTIEQPRTMIAYARTLRDRSNPHMLTIPYSGNFVLGKDIISAFQKSTYPAPQNARLVIAGLEVTDDTVISVKSMVTEYGTDIVIVPMPADV